MDQETKVAEIQQVMLEVKKQDLEESPDAYNTFECDCCGETKMMAGAIPYSKYLFCNDCAILTEVSLYLGKIQLGHEMVNVMENKRLATQCDYIKTQQKYLNN